MADNEPPEEISVSATELPWPDPSRPIVSNQYGGYGQQPGGIQTGSPSGGVHVNINIGRRRWPMITTVLVLILLALVVVWLLWWR